MQQQPSNGENNKRPVAFTVGMRLMYFSKEVELKQIHTTHVLVRYADSGVTFVTTKDTFQQKDVVK